MIEELEQRLAELPARRRGAVAWHPAEVSVIAFVHGLPDGLVRDAILRRRRLTSARSAPVQSACDLNDPRPARSRVSPFRRAGLRASPGVRISGGMTRARARCGACSTVRTRRARSGCSRRCRVTSEARVSVDFRPEATAGCRDRSLVVHASLRPSQVVLRSARFQTARSAD
jgi:hypothetical protein